MINSFGNLSTGKIACQLARDYEKNGDTCYVAYARGDLPNDIKGYKIGNKIGIYMHAILARCFDSCGFHSSFATNKLVKWIKKYNPDLVHIHNLHGYYINVRILFNFLKKENIKVRWTFHDCWSFTGHCCYFTYKKCEKWMIECEKCPNLRQYPKAIIDKSRRNYKLKKNIFTSLNDMEIITPSNWLKTLVENSFLSKYHVLTIKNKIDLSTFKPIKSNFKELYNITNKRMILGVASTWDSRKGLDFFVELDKKINHDECIIVLVGLSEKQIKDLSQKTNILCLNRTKTQFELVKIYSSADLFFNPTLEDNYPTVNLEAQACGTPVVSFDTGGCAETDMKNGLFYLADKNNYYSIIIDLLRN